MSKYHATVEREPNVPTLRLHLNENPAGASPAALKAAEDALRHINRYPDPANHDLTHRLAAWHGVSVNRIAIGNGTDELILMLAIVHRQDHRPAAVNGQTFQSYPKSLRALGIPYVELPLKDYALCSDDVIEGFDRGAGLVFVCNPHNPTGTVLSPGDVGRLCQAAQRHRALLVLDEAYAEYVEPPFATGLPWAGHEGHVCVMRTFSKAYGLAALRVGYLVGDPDVVARVNGLQAAFPFHVNRLAQIAAARAIEDQDFIYETRYDNQVTRRWFCAELDRLGLGYVPSHTNFVLLKLPGHGPRIATELAGRGHTSVRDTSDMGMPGHLRVSIGKRREMTDFLEELSKII